MTVSYVRSIATRWPVGSALLLFALTGQVWASPLIYGWVTTPSGTLLVDAVVTATDANYRVYRATVARDGFYAMYDPRPGTYTITVVARGLEAPPARDQALNAGEWIQHDFKLEEAKPLWIVRSPRPIAVTDDIDSAAFSDAPEIKIDSGANVAVGNPREWGGPTAVSGRFRVKYSEVALHLAGDLIYKNPGLNNNAEGDLWNGDALEVAFQNDPYRLDRTGYDPDHNWQLLVGLGEKPQWWLGGKIQTAPTQSLATSFLRKDRPNKDGYLIRLDIPWAILRQGDAGGEPIAAPKENDLGAMDVLLDAADREVDRAAAGRKFQLSWSGYSTSAADPSALRPVTFCAQAP